MEEKPDQTSEKEAPGKEGSIEDTLTKYTQECLTKTKLTEPELKEFFEAYLSTVFLDSGKQPNFHRYCTRYSKYEDELSDYTLKCVALFGIDLKTKIVHKTEGLDSKVKKLDDWIKELSKMSFTAEINPVLAKLQKLEWEQKKLAEKVVEINAVYVIKQLTYGVEILNRIKGKKPVSINLLMPLYTFSTDYLDALIKMVEGGEETIYLATRDLIIESLNFITANIEGYYRFMVEHFKDIPNEQLERMYKHAVSTKTRLRTLLTEYTMTPMTPEVKQEVDHLNKLIVTVREDYERVMTMEKKWIRDINPGDNAAIQAIDDFLNGDKLDNESLITLVLMSLGQLEGDLDVVVPVRRVMTMKEDPDNPADKDADKPVDKAGDKVTDKVTDKAVDKPVDKVTEKVADKSGDKTGDKATDMAEPDLDKPPERTWEDTVDQVFGTSWVSAKGDNTQDLEDITVMDEVKPSDRDIADKAIAEPLPKDAPEPAPKEPSTEAAPKEAAPTQVPPKEPSSEETEPAFFSSALDKLKGLFGKREEPKEEPKEEPTEAKPTQSNAIQAKPTQDDPQGVLFDMDQLQSLFITPVQTKEKQAQEKQSEDQVKAQEKQLQDKMKEIKALQEKSDQEKIRQDKLLQETLQKERNDFEKRLQAQIENERAALDAKLKSELKAVGNSSETKLDAQRSELETKLKAQADQARATQLELEKKLKDQHEQARAQREISDTAVKTQAELERTALEEKLKAQLQTQQTALDTKRKDHEDARRRMNEKIEQLEKQVKEGTNSSIEEVKKELRKLQLEREQDGIKQAAERARFYSRQRENSIGSDYHQDRSRSSHGTISTKSSRSSQDLSEVDVSSPGSTSSKETDYSQPERINSVSDLRLSVQGSQPASQSSLQPPGPRSPSASSAASPASSAASPVTSPAASPAASPASSTASPLTSPASSAASPVTSAASPASPASSAVSPASSVTSPEYSSASSVSSAASSAVSQLDVGPPPTPVSSPVSSPEYSDAYSLSSAASSAISSLSSASSSYRSPPQYSHTSQVSSEHSSLASSPASYKPRPENMFARLMPKIPQSALNAPLPETPTNEINRDKNKFIEETFQPVGRYISLFNKPKKQDETQQERAITPEVLTVDEPPVEPLQEQQQLIRPPELPVEPLQEQQQLIRPPEPPAGPLQVIHPPEPPTEQQQFIAKTFQPFPSYITLFKPEEQPLNGLFEWTDEVVPPLRSMRARNNVTKPMKEPVSNETDLSEPVVGDPRVLLDLLEQSELQSNQYKALRKERFEVPPVNGPVLQPVKEVFSELTQKANGSADNLLDAAIQAAKNAETFSREKAAKEDAGRKMFTLFKKRDLRKRINKRMKDKAKEVEDAKLKNDARRKILKAVKIAADEVKAQSRNLFSELGPDEAGENIAFPPLPPRNRIYKPEKSTAFPPPQHPRAPIRGSGGFEPHKLVPTIAPVVQPVQENSRPLNRLELKQKEKEAIKLETEKHELLEKVEVAELGTDEGRTVLETFVSKAMEPVNEEPVDLIAAKIRDIENHLERPLGKLTNSQREQLEQDLKEAKEELVKRQVEREKRIEEKALFLDILNRKLRDPLNLQIQSSNAIVTKVAALLATFEYISKDFTSTRNHYIYLIPELVLNPFPHTQVDSYPDTLLYYLYHYHVIGVYLDALNTFYDGMVKISKDIPAEQTMTETFKQIYFTKKQNEVDAILGEMIKQVQSNLVFPSANGYSSRKERIHGRLEQLYKETKALETKLTRIKKVLSDSKRMRLDLLGKFGVEYDDKTYVPFFKTILRKETSRPTSSDQKEGVFRIFDIMGKVVNNTGRLLSAGRGFSAPRPGLKPVSRVKRGTSVNRPPTVVDSTRPPRRIPSLNSFASAGVMSPKTQDNKGKESEIPQKVRAKGKPPLKRPVLPMPSGIAPEPEVIKVRVDTPRSKLTGQNPIMGTSMNSKEFLGRREGPPDRGNDIFNTTLNENVKVGIEESDPENMMRTPVGQSGVRLLRGTPLNSKRRFNPLIETGLKERLDRRYETDAKGQTVSLSLNDHEVPS